MNHPHRVLLVVPWWDEAQAMMLKAGLQRRALCGELYPARAFLGMA